MANIRRRQFWQATGIGAGAAALSCLGLGYLAVRPPAADIDFHEHSAEDKEEGMGRVLGAYASKLGSTGAVARAVA
jgi:hypothetical protein